MDLKTYVLKHGEEPYDPVKAHEYYMRTRHLKGRRHGSKVQPSSKRNTAEAKLAHVKLQREANARVAHLRARLDNLHAVLQKMLADAHKSSTPKEKTPAQKAKARQESKKSHERHKQAEKAKAASRPKSKSSGGSSSGSSSKSMTVDEVKKKISEVHHELEAAIARARRIARS